MQTLLEWQQSGDWLQHRGHDIFFRQGGANDAPTLLLVHGFPTASYDWEPLWQRLCQHFFVLAPDMTGFGFSAKPHRYAYSIFDQADMLQALLQQLRSGPVHLLTHDYGDTVAQELLARQQQHGSPDIRSVVLLNGGLFPETHKPVLLQKLLISPIGPLIARLSNFDSFRRNFDHICAQPLSESLLRDYWQLLCHNDGRLRLPQLIRYMSERRQFRSRWVGALQNASVPVRLVNGVEDPISGAHMVSRYRELITQPDVITLPGVGHYPQVEAADQVWEAALAFWREHIGD